MLRSAQNDGMPLPKGWPLCIHSAIVHAVSMANVAFTVTRSVSARRRLALIALPRSYMQVAW